MAEERKRIIYRLNYTCTCKKLDVNAEVNSKIGLATHVNSILSHAEHTNCVVDLIVKLDRE